MNRKPKQLELFPRFTARLDAEAGSLLLRRYQEQLKRLQRLRAACTSRIDRRLKLISRLRRRVDKAKKTGALLDSEV